MNAEDTHGTKDHIKIILKILDNVKVNSSIIKTTSSPKPTAVDVPDVPDSENHSSESFNERTSYPDLVSE